MIYLLDLNYTLVTNSDTKIKPFSEQIKQEIYDIDLIEKIKNNHVILITARPPKYLKQTLENIKTQTGWEPNEAYFNTYNLPPFILKPKILREIVFKKHGEDPNNYFGIESNPKTRSEYLEQFKIKSMPKYKFYV